MKSIAFSLSLLAAAVSTVVAQTTTTDDFTATVTPRTFTKGRSSSLPTSVPSSSSSASSSFYYSNSSTPNTASPYTTSSVPIGAVVTPEPSLSAQGATYVSPADGEQTPSSTSSVAEPTVLDAATAGVVLAQHNAKRALHQDTQPLEWSDELSTWAFNYVNSLKGTSNDPCSGNLVHSSGRSNQGENIAFGTYSSAEALVDYWYAEVSDYDYNDVTGVSHNGKDVGHFTQLVWASSSQVGCAAVECPANSGLYLLCEYTPAGNVYVGNSDDTYELFRSNVLPLK